MKKIIFGLVFVILAVALAGGIYVYVTYENTTEDSIPPLYAEVFGQDMTPVNTTWYTPTFMEYLYKDFAITEEKPAPIPVQAPMDAGLVYPTGYTTSLKVTKDDVVVFEGDAETFSQEVLTETGVYTIQITSEKPQADGEAYGVFVFEVDIEWTPEPELETMVLFGDNVLQQGDIFVVQVLDAPEDVVPTAETDMGQVVFTPMDRAQSFSAVIAVGHDRAVGEYPMTVTVGTQEFSQTVTVEAFDFLQQNLEIDTSDPVISEANSAEAYEQYRQTIPPLWETYDEEKYWDGEFIWPAEGRITSEYGVQRITNGDASTLRTHAALDIANAEGTPIIAPGAGRVVFADVLLNTGGTIVIEHGGGLKSYYYHLLEIDVVAGEMVEQGQQIALMGTTGYSTGSHLHFEMRIFEETISPTMLFTSDAGAYSLPDVAIEGAVE